MDKKDILICVSLFFAAFLIRAVGVANVCMVWDEWLYWFKTFEILANNWAPVPEAFEGSSPFFSYIGAVVTVLFGGDLNTLRLISVIFGSLTVPTLYLFGKAMYDRKTGLLAALFMCFSAYHCLYSRILMLEAFGLFFVTAFLYIFWLSQRSDNKKSVTYAIIAGALLGLAIAAKYLPIFLVPAVLIYVLWTKRFSFKAILDKRIILMLIFALLIFSPMIIGLFSTGKNPVDFYVLRKYENGVSMEGGIERFEKGVAGGGFSVLAVSLDKLFVKFVNKIAEILTWGAWILTPSWSAFFVLSAILLFLITLLYYLPKFINRGKEGSFLLISLITLYLFLYVFTPATKYYLIYSFPIYFVMLSHLAIDSFYGFKKEKKYKNIFNIFINILIIVFLFSSIFISVTSPYWDVGEPDWITGCVEYIKVDAVKSKYDENILIGVAIKKPGNIDHSIYMNNLNASTVRIITPKSKYGERLSIDIGKIKELKPHYLIVSEAQYDILFKSDVKKEIFEDYEIVFHSRTFYSYNGFVLKRKNIQTPPKSLLRDKEGEISQDIFKRSVPSVMEVGKVDTVLVQVKNTGDFRTNFVARVHSEKFIVQGDSGEIALDKGSTYLFKFKIVPIKEYVGDLPVTVDLYVKHGEDETYVKKVDAVTDYIYLIKN